VWKVVCSKRQPHTHTQNTHLAEAGCCNGAPLKRPEQLRDGLPQVGFDDRLRLVGVKGWHAVLQLAQLLDKLS
jgi:hypothetical protein